MSELTPPRITLERFRNPDGGFGLHPGHPSEPEPTAMAVLALGDEVASEWLVEHQRPDGSFGLVDGPFADEASTALAALALPDGQARRSALDHVEASRGERTPPIDGIPLDGSIPGWGWTEGTASWVEPSARALWALRLLRPGSPRIADAVALLRDREAVSGGWNYGNRTVLGFDLPPNAVTTSLSLIALRGIDPALEERAVVALRRIWATDTPGPLTLAMAIVALRRHDAEADVALVRTALDDALRETSLPSDAVAWSWIVLADGRDEAIFP